MTQTDRVLAYLRQHPEGLTQADCYRLDMGTRLAARISDARERLDTDEDIQSRTEVHAGGTHARYVLVRRKPAQQALPW